IDLYLRHDQCPTDEQRTAYRDLVRRCANHEPIAYLTQNAHFYSLQLHVTPDVLIPRPETELLVDQAIDFLRLETDLNHPRVLDLCTGTACIALAIAANSEETQLLATDKSPSALAVAQKNITTCDLTSRVTLLESDLFEALDPHLNQFDLIVSNPPYIATEEFDRLPPNVRNFEPPEALLAGADGLDAIRNILRDAHRFLKKNAPLMIEVAYNQADSVIALFKKSQYLDRIETIKDPLGHRRIVKARKAKE
ncbi:MAG: peptide chain release factor N(5)-glutamine methyltransferase, partial [Planctomycetes bacterium]|nr:peptide chain release factor N(5)-glutamine methyltransferase [Planctomycetota bacterium]